MRFIFLFCLVALLALITVNATSQQQHFRKMSRRNHMSPKNYNFRKNFISDFDDFFPESFSSRRQRKYPRTKYTRLLLNRQMFFYWDSNYEKWTNWSNCSPKSCMKSRFRKCKDNSWEENVNDFRLQKKCPVKFIYEKKTCNDTKECIKLKIMRNESVTTLPENCGVKPREIENKIFGGNEAQKNAWPWHVGLYANTKYRSIYICGGTLINPGWIVTAAHCLKTVKKVNSVPLGKLIDTRKYEVFESFRVIIGDHDRSKITDEEVTRKISHFIIHPSFRADYTSNLYDVALLKIDEPLPKDLDISFACVPKMKNFTMNKSDKCFAIGWGNVESKDPANIWSFEFDFYLERWRRNRRTPRNSFVLQEVNIPLIDFEKCREKYHIFNLNKDIHLCAGSSSQDTCRGDSGGGLFCLDTKTNRWQLYGITNFGSTRGCGISYGVYIRVAEVSDWIRNVIKEKTTENTIMSNYK